MDNGINKVNGIINPTPVKHSKRVGEIHENFGQTLNQAIQKVNHSQLQSDEILVKFVSGEVTNIHDVMIATQKAGITRQLTIEVRDKAVDAYKEIMRMQI
ncbi:flagellar hook-basal body complex protein FliE (plasmid) [Rossellomorea sp. AcN35-11]|nr:flagellar hook-basal body complex protein FliE [Rossellomorea aquimaris]WJV32278.1 flagellar hook-basal body complex protein FliE [Rossellomorea sp. AcN35-11]